MTKRAKGVTVESLAKELDSEPDELIVMLWDLGLDDIRSADSQIPPRQVERVRTALGLPTMGEQTRIDYWTSTLDLSRSEFEKLLQELGFKVSAAAKRLPKGALKKLRRNILSSSSAAEDIARMAAPIDSSQANMEIDPSAESPTPSSLEPTPARSDTSRSELPTLSWELIGQPREVKFLTADEVLSIHASLTRDFARSHDPISPPGIRDRGMLESAVNRPTIGLGSERKYPTVEMAGAALLHSLVLNHAFHNGNKRTGLVASLAFLEKNSYIPTCSQEDLFTWTLRLASHSLLPHSYQEGLDISDHEVQALARLMKKSTRQIDKGERPITWLVLLRILKRFDCTIDVAAGPGTRKTIIRQVPRQTRKGRPKRRPKTVKVKVNYASDGTEVDRRTLHNVRSRLHLDDDHGTDSVNFYEDKTTDEFIQEYRKILKRLARL